MSNDLKCIFIYMMIIGLLLFLICACVEFYYLKEEARIMRQHNELALELRVKRLEDILQ